MSRNEKEYQRMWRKNNPEKVKLQRIKGRNTECERYHKYKGNAKRKNIKFHLSRKEFSLFWKKSCHYCNSEIKTIGLDRVNNTKGYIIDNIVSCCAICNGMKETLTVNEFLNHCKKIINYQNVGVNKNL